MELGPLHSFLEVARQGHLTRAAQHLHLSQPAVSAQLARLEDELGTALFHRTPKGMDLTQAGALFRSYVEEALVRLDDGCEAVAALEGLGRGTLRVGGGATATTYLLPPLFRTFHDRYPAIQLFVREQGSSAVVDAVLSGALDLGVVTLPVEPRAAAELTATPWVQDDLRLIVPSGHALAGRDQFRWSELEGEALVLFEGGTAVRRRIDDALSSAGIAVAIVMELRSIESIKQMVAQGIGAAFVSRFALPADDAGLRPRRGGQSLHRDLAVVTRRDRTPGPAARAFLELMDQSDSAVPSTDARMPARS